jgi:hypothetical protein
MYHLLYNTKTLHSARTVCLCISYESYDKRRSISPPNIINWLIFVAGT